MCCEQALRPTKPREAAFAISTNNFLTDLGRISSDIILAIAQKSINKAIIAYVKVKVNGV